MKSEGGDILIIKSLQKPLQLRMNEGLVRRIHKQHDKIDMIKDDLLKRTAGFKGEKLLELQLRNLDQYKYQIYYGLRLPIGEQFFQIDALVVCNHFILILEVKNMAGTVIFDNQFHQLIRVLDNKEEGFQDPISQAKRHRLLLKSFLEKERIPPIPIFYYIVISKPSTIIKTTNKNGEPLKVIHLHQLPFTFLEFENMMEKEFLDKKQLNKLKRVLLKSHETLFPNKLRFGIHDEEVKPGVFCSYCKNLGMIRLRTTWYCIHCKQKNQEAHVQAVLDYMLLMQKEVKNDEIQKFLQLESSSTVRYLIRRENIPHEGNYSARTYDLAKHFQDIL